MGLGCSEKNKIRSKAKWLCKYGQIENLETKYLPEGEDPSKYIRSKDLSYHKEKEKENESGLGKALQAGFAPVAKTMSEAAAKETTCKMKNIKVNDRSATVKIERSVPDIKKGLKKMGELTDIESDKKRLKKAREIYEKAESEKSSEHNIDFVRGQDGWRANLHLEKREIEKKLDSVKEKMKKAKSKLKEIEKEKKESEKAEEKLKRFKILSAEFEQRRRRYLDGLKPFINLKVKNETGKAISRAYFHGVAKSPDRTVPWVEGDFNYEVPGGVEPGEEVEWTLAPNMYSDWAKTKVPDDANFEVKVVRVDGPEGNALYVAPTGNLSKQLKEQQRKVSKVEKKVDKYKKELKALAE